jgi:hypothetical protein
VDQVIQSAKSYLDEGKPSDIKLLLRDLVERIEVSGEEVTLLYTFRKPDTEVAYVLAPRVGATKRGCGPISPSTT